MIVSLPLRIPRFALYSPQCAVHRSAVAVRRYSLYLCTGLERNFHILYCVSLRAIHTFRLVAAKLARYFSVARLFRLQILKSYCSLSERQVWSRQLVGDAVSPLVQQPSTFERDTAAEHLGIDRAAAERFGIDKASALHFVGYADTVPQQVVSAGLR